jgi:hypothetical protein
VDRALARVLSPPESAADAAEDPYQSPLGFMRINRGCDSRGEAARLAAALARTHHEKERVRAATFSLVGDDSASAYWVTRALQRLGDKMAPDVGLLSGQNWALKSFAAILWAKTTEPEPVGYRLATDSDVRVRRALAMHLAESERDEAAGTLKVKSSVPAAVAKPRAARAALLNVLRQDPCFSVRSAATTGASTPKRLHVAAVTAGDGSAVVMVAKDGAPPGDEI